MYRRSTDKRRTANRNDAMRSAPTRRLAIDARKLVGKAGCESPSFAVTFEEIPAPRGQFGGAWSAVAEKVMIAIINFERQCQGARVDRHKCHIKQTKSIVALGAFVRRVFLQSDRSAVRSNKFLRLLAKRSAKGQRQPKPVRCTSLATSAIMTKSAARCAFSRVSLICTVASSGSSVLYAGTTSAERYLAELKGRLRRLRA